jgi:hypothetical protein
VPPSLESVVPEWTSRTAQQVLDAYWLARGAAEETGHWRWKARFNAMYWALFGGTAPFDGTKYERPPTEPQVFEALMVAEANRQNPDSVAAAWARGVSDMLTWLAVGTSDPGFVIPRRLPAGRTPTEDEFYAERLADNKAVVPLWGPEEYDEARWTAHSLATQHRLAAEAADRAAARYGLH